MDHIRSVIEDLELHWTAFFPHPVHAASRNHRDFFQENSTAKVRFPAAVRGTRTGVSVRVAIEPGCLPRTRALQRCTCPVGAAESAVYPQRSELNVNSGSTPPPLSRVRPFTPRIMATSNASITLYSFHGCPYAHRAHIALAELGLKYDEVAIDLSRPREPWYLKINPVSTPPKHDSPTSPKSNSFFVPQQRGLVPSLTYKHPALGATGHTFTESGVLIQFLCDMHPSHLLPASNTPMGALFRARLNFFVDTWNTKVGTLMFAMYKAAKDEEKEAIAREWVSAVEKEIEPLLKDAGPFFGGQSRMTLAEVSCRGPALIRCGPVWLRHI